MTTMMMGEHMDRIVKYIKTHEDWHPSYRPLEDGNPLMVPALRVAVLKLTEGGWRVCVWGLDDFGMEKDGHSQQEAGALFDSIQDFTTIGRLKELGFVYA